MAQFNCKFIACAVAPVLVFAVLPAAAEITIERMTESPVKLYETFEAVLDLGGNGYSNPFDPDEIDVSAVFTSPSGKEWSIIAFYDDYRHAGEWKVRFSPNETGLWQFTISKKDRSGREESEACQFTADPSTHHGWIRVSEENPHYLIHEDGTGFYGVGAYTPWRNSRETFDELESIGGNVFAIWNINYGGMVNGSGLIEEELGRYNQEKCGRIDSLLRLSEERGLKCMLAVWPHDLFSETVWAHQWHNNPYNALCGVEEVYSDPECWEYQKKQYRYLIARWAHSRAFGFWEIINELNGTDAWAAGRHDEVLEWVDKVNRFFRANDPYQHPATASRSGGYGEYWAPLHEAVDLPNLHLYESQGWPRRHDGNPLRSSLSNYAEACSRLWDNFEKPAIIGESGWDWVYVDLYSPEYTALYHNALWTCLTHGLAMTPLWWEFKNPLREEDRAQMSILADFVRDIDFISGSREHFEEVNEEYDLFGMKGDSTAFGWIRQAGGLDIGGLQVDLVNILDPAVPVYAISYYDTWSGQELGTRIRPHVNNLFRDTLPYPERIRADMAFKIEPAQGGERPARLELSADAYRILNRDTLSVGLACYVLDDGERFCPGAEVPVTFTLDGPGGLAGDNPVNTRGGAAFIDFKSSEQHGVSNIIAASPGMVSDTVTIRIKDRRILDDFEDYGSDIQLQNSWYTTWGTTATVTLDSTEKAQGRYGMRLDYGIGEGHKVFARIETEVHGDYSGGNYLMFWVKPDGAQRELEIWLRERGRRRWICSTEIPGSDPVMVSLPLTDFSCNDESTPIDLSALYTMTLTIRKGSGAADGTGTLYFDHFYFPESAPSGLDDGLKATAPDQYGLGQNYPNPFNASTTIDYRLGRRDRINIAVFNVNGQRIDTLVRSVQDAGQHTISWTANGLPSGIYFYRIETREYSAVKKCMLLR